MYRKCRHKWFTPPFDHLDAIDLEALTYCEKCGMKKWFIIYTKRLKRFSIKAVIKHRGGDLNA